jgi:response regulator RpfG family c-di-GMP phosphodiesterase
VRSFVARPAAIRAAIARYYEGDPHAFVHLIMPDGSAFWPVDADASPVGGAGDEEPGTVMGRPPGSASSSSEPSGLLVVPQWGIPLPSGSGLSAPATTPTATGLRLEEPPHDALRGVSADAYLETLNTFVSLLEQGRAELRGHSSQVARLCKALAERVGLNAQDRHALLVAAYLHDVGKGPAGRLSGGVDPSASDLDGRGPLELHLTALNVARHEAHRVEAARLRDAAARLFASAALPELSVRILEHLYERFDGQGFPDRLAGKDIPYGSRVLALVETYCDLVTNPRNPYRRTLTAPQALSVVKELSGPIFDPTLSMLLRHVVLGPGASAHSVGGARALLVDPDHEETAILEMRLLEQGFAVKVVRDLAAAREALRVEAPDLILSEVDLTSSGDGFELMSAVGELPGVPRPALIFVTRRADRESVSRGFALGATDYLLKPASPELIATKAAQVMADATRRHSSGVSGSLREMALPDVVQILANGRRGGRLQLVDGGKRGEIHFSEGQIHDARFGSLEGEEAFYAMLKLGDGTFSLDPGFVPSRRVIHTSTESMLLEGMRRLDEHV